MKFHIFLIYSITLTIISCSSENNSVKVASSKKFSPVAFNSSIVAKTGTPITFYAPIGTDKDTLKSDLIYKITKAPTHGIISDHCFLNTKTHSSRSCRYFSDDNYEGIDTIEYQIIDQDNQSSEKAYVDIFISKNNDTKVISKYINKSQSSGFDIVWVLDKSETMLKKRHELQDNLVSLVKHFSKNQNKYSSNFRMAFIDSSAFSGNENRFVFARNYDGNIFDLTSKLAEEDFDSFQNNFARAISQRRMAKTPGRMLASIDKAYRTENIWFQDKDRNLFYILISNNNELSYKTGSFPGNENYTSIENWYNKFIQTVSEPNQFKVYPIVDFKVTKTKTSSDLYDRYHQIAKTSGGELFDISKPLSSSLDQIGRKIASSQNTQDIELNSNNLKANNIEVFVNRKKVDENNWSLDNKKIIFKSKLKMGDFLQIKHME